MQITRLGETKPEREQAKGSQKRRTRSVPDPKRPTADKPKPEPSADGSRIDVIA